MPWLTFMKEVVRSNKTTGALGPSSKALAEAVTEVAGLSGAKTVVEYGCGEGVFTEVICRKLDPEAFFLSLEVNAALVEVTRKRCPGDLVIHDGAQNTSKHLTQHGKDHCDVIVSSLPWSRFDTALQNEILEATYEVLAPGGRFVTFAYTFSPLFRSGRHFFQDTLPKKFPSVRRVGPIFKNFPPCHIYVAVKPQSK